MTPIGWDISAKELANYHRALPETDKSKLSKSTSRTRDKRARRDKGKGKGKKGKDKGKGRRRFNGSRIVQASSSKDTRKGGGKGKKT